MIDNSINSLEIVVDDIFNDLNVEKPIPSITWVPYVRHWINVLTKCSNELKSIQRKNRIKFSDYKSSVLIEFDTRLEYIDGESNCIISKLEAKKVTKQVPNKQKKTDGLSHRYDLIEQKIDGLNELSYLEILIILYET